MKIIFYIIKYFFIKILKKQSLGTFIKNVCENMGVTYIKLAQILSTRNDLFLDEQNRKDLSSINENCNKLNFDYIKATIEKDYNKPLEKVFKEFDKEPIGYASISQVHKAVLLNGDPVAVKVKRSDLTINMKKDFKIINFTLRFLSLFSQKFKYVFKSGAINNYFSWILSETDFKQEKQNLITMYNYTKKLNEGHNIKNLKDVVPLIVYDNLCTDNVIVMEYISYKTLNNMELTEENMLLIKNAINSYLKMYFYAIFNFDTIYFHGDPHPGNMFIDNNGNLGFIDFGLVFSMSSEELDIIKQLAISMYTKDLDKLYNIVLKLSKKYGFTYKERKKEEKLRTDLKIYLNKLDDISVTNWFTEIALLIIDNDLPVPAYFYGFSKALVIFDGITLFTGNDTKANELLYNQFKEYYVKSIANNIKTNLIDVIKENKPLFLDIIKDSIADIPDFITSIIN